MLDSLQLTNDLVFSYKKTADAMDAIMREHELAMVVYDLEDTVACGIIPMHRWIRLSNQWEERVSKSFDLYNQKKHDELKAIGALLKTLGEAVIRMIDSAVDFGYTINREEQFRELLDKVESMIDPLPTEFQREVLQGYHDRAVADYCAGKTEEVDNPWS